MLTPLNSPSSPFPVSIFINLYLYSDTVATEIGMVKELTGGYKVKYHSNGLDNDPIEIDFTPPFRSVCNNFV